MKSRDLLLATVVVLAIGGSATGQPGVRSDQAPASTVDLLGAWRLVSIATVRPGGEEVTDWMGPKPSGFKLEGDRLLLTATPFTFKGELRYNKLAWQRIR